MTKYQLSKNCSVRVVMVGNSRSIQFDGSDVPSMLGSVMPDDAVTGVNYACKFLNLTDSDRKGFKNYLLSKGFN